MKLDTPSPDSTPVPPQDLSGSSSAGPSTGEGIASAATAAQREWYRFVLLSTGRPLLAAKILSEVLQEAGEKVGQFRDPASRLAWLVRTLRDRSRISVVRSEEAAVEPWSKVAALPETERTLMALFYSLPLDPTSYSELLGAKVKVAELLAKARQTLCPEDYFPTGPTVPLYRAWAKDASGAAKAVRKIKDSSDASQKKQLAAQTKLDGELREALEKVDIPPGTVLPEWRDLGAVSERSTLNQPAIWAIGVALLVVIGVVLFGSMRPHVEYPGKAEVHSIVESSYEGEDFETMTPVEARSLEDWFLVKGVEGLSIPAELEKAKVSGGRILKLRGRPVVQLVFDKRDASLLLFKASDQNVQLDSSDWLVYEEGEEKVVGVRVQNGVCFVLTYLGDAADWSELISSLSEP